MYVPSPPVFVVRTWPVAALVAVTVALGTTAPVVSFMVPVSAPVEGDWAPRVVARNRQIKKNAHTHFAFIIQVSFACRPIATRNSAG